MKYIKYYLVDAVSGEFIFPGDPAPNGKRHPEMQGLDVKFSFLDDRNFESYLAVCDDVEIDQASGVEELTEQEVLDLLEVEFDQVKDGHIREVYGIAQSLRERQLSDWYHHSELAYAASVKHTEALAAQAAANDADADVAAPNLKIEAEHRGITTKELAALVIAKFDEMSALEAKFAGVRGSKTDQLQAITFDSTSVDGALDSIRSLSNVDLESGWE